MKKLLFLLSGLLITLSLSLGSCSPKEPKDMSNEQLIELYQKNAEEGLKYLKEGNTKKIDELDEKMKPILEELNKRDLNEKEQKQLEEIATKIFKEVMENPDINFFSK